MKHITLVLNVGSSSVKFAVAQGHTIVLHGSIDHLGKQAIVHIVGKKHETNATANIPTIASALVAVQQILSDKNITPNRIAHRIVHGGQRFSKPTQLTSSAINYLHSLIELAPLHQPANLLGVTFAKKVWPRASEWGVFDTGLYHDLPIAVRTYALPKALTDKLHIRKYGFHGISHGWAFHQAVKKLRRPAKTTSAVSLHLGSGASMTLWHNGRAVDTTMGFTPLEGLVMATRSGDIDPAIPLYIQQKLGWTAKKTEQMLEQRAGLIGLSGLKDMRDVLTAAGHPVPGWKHGVWSGTQRAEAALALKMFVYHAQRTLSGYLGLLAKPNAIIFTGPIGENTTIQRLIIGGIPAARGIHIVSVHANEEQAIVEALDA